MPTNTPGAPAKPAAKKRAAAKSAPNKKAAAARKSAVVKSNAPVAKKSVAAKPKAAAAKKSAVAKTKPTTPAKEKIKKSKLVRDSFTMPEAEYQVLADVKKACIKAGFEIKKSELLRVGVALICKSDPAQLKAVLASLPPLKAGRPKKNK